MDRYQVELTSSPGEDVVFVKALRIVGKISLQDAVKVHALATESPGCVLVSGIERDVADHIADHFMQAGIAVIVTASSLTTPMICAPEANAIHQPRAFRMGFAVDDSK